MELAVPSASASIDTTVQPQTKIVYPVITLAKCALAALGKAA
jgi:hypothetical protein